MLGEMIRLLLNAAGIATIDRSRIGATSVVRKALLSGEVDLYVEYTGNAGLFFNDSADPAWKDLQRGYQLGARLDYAAHHIVWLTPAPASNAWALAVRRDVAAANHLSSMSDFGRWVAGGGHQRRQHRHGVRHRRRHCRREARGAQRRPPRPAGIRPGAADPRGRAEGEPADRGDRPPAHAELRRRDAAAAQCTGADQR